MGSHHLEEGDIQALLDGELPQPRAAAALRHIGSCQACATVYDDLEEASTSLTAALALLDDGRPAFRPTLNPPSAARRRPWGAISLAKAATFLLIFGAAASATLPGSPLRRWIVGRAEQPTAVALDQRVGANEQVTEPTGEPPLEAGTAAAPELGRLRIVLTRPERGMTVRAVLVESPSGGAYIVGDAASAQFDGTTGRVEVIDATGGQLRIEIPRAAVTASVEIDGRVYLVKEGDSLRLMDADPRISGGDLEFRIE